MKENIKSLADELRKSIVTPSSEEIIIGKNPGKRAAKNNEAKSRTDPVSALIKRIEDFDCAANKQMLHPRIDTKTIALLNSFKLATGIDMNKVVAFSIANLFSTHPELKKFIKHTLNNLDL